MKRFVLAILLLCLCLNCMIGLSEASKTDSSVLYEMGIKALYDWTLSDYQALEKASNLFTNVGAVHKLARLYKLYTDALLSIVHAEEDDGALDRADDLLWLIGQYEDFVTDLNERGLLSCEELAAYVKARKLEAEGDIESAYKAYTGLYILDSIERQLKLRKVYQQQRYETAMRLYNDGQFYEASLVFEELGTYADSFEMFTRAKAQHRHIWLDATCEQPAICSICGEKEGTALGHAWLPATQYAPETCMRCGRTRGEPLPTKEVQPTITPKPIATATPKPVQLHSLRVGEYTKFGHYEQDNNRTNGSEPIEWIVLDVQNSTALLVSRYVLDWRFFNPTDSLTYWAKSDICNWLNNSFANEAFDEAEKEQIVCEINSAASGVFLLSENEVRMYLTSVSERLTVPTVFCINQGAFQWASTGGCHWWLRDNVINGSKVYAKGITGSGDYDLAGQPENVNRRGVRPAIWVKVGY